MSPKELISRLSQLAEEARHHPEPAVAVQQLAVLVLELARQLEPMAAKFSILLQAAGFPDPSLSGLVDQVEAELAAGQDAHLVDTAPASTEPPAAA